MKYQIKVNDQIVQSTISETDAWDFFLAYRYLQTHPGDISLWQNNKQVAKISSELN
jgi:hypothetical protein